jgi:MFS family permease
VALPKKEILSSLEPAADRAKRRAWILPFSLFLFVIAIDSIDFNSYSPVMPQIKSAWTMTNTKVGIYTGTVGLISILVAVPIGEAVRRWGVKRAVVGAVALMIGGSQVSIMSFAPLAMAQRWGMDPQAIGNGIGISYAVGVPVMFLAGILADRLHTRKKIMIATAMPMAAGLFMLTSSNQTIFMLGLVGYLGFAFAPGAMLYACAPDVVPKGINLGPVYGLLATISSAGSFFIPIIVGWMRDATGHFSPGFILLGTLCTVSILLCLKLKAR